MHSAVNISRIAKQANDETLHAWFYRLSPRLGTFQTSYLLSLISFPPKHAIWATHAYKTFRICRSHSDCMGQHKRFEVSRSTGSVANMAGHRSLFSRQNQEPGKHNIFRHCITYYSVSISNSVYASRNKWCLACMPHLTNVCLI
jgi:hypothetical protein